MMQPWINQPQPALLLDGREVAPQQVARTPCQHRFAYPAGLVVTAVVDALGPHRLWRWTITHRGSTDSPPITGFYPLCIDLPCRGKLAPIIHGSRGGHNDPIFPPTTFTQWRRTTPTESYACNSRIIAGSTHGRSSDGDLPLFIVEQPENAAGMFFGIGWSGNWHMIARRDGNQLNLRAGMYHLHVALRPGETITQPSILIGEYTGTAADGQRELRRTLRDHVQPTLAGSPMMPPASWDSYYGDRGTMTRDRLLEQIPLCAKVGCEHFVLDGGWTGGGEDGRFESLLPHVGSWRADPNRFPDGLAPIRAALDQHRMKLGLWFDIEHAHEQSLACQTYPHLFTEQSDANGCRLLRLDLPEARDFAVRTISGNVREHGAKWIRFDANVRPAEAWSKLDAPLRQGMTQIRYIEHLYQLLDALRDRFPDLVIENCASGGQRIDVETLARTHTDWISDHCESEAIVRYHLHGAARWLPAHRLNTGFAHGLLEPTRADWTKPLPAGAYLSHFGGAFGLNEYLAGWSPAAIEKLRDHIALWKATRIAFAGDVFTFGQQHDADRGPCGLAGIDPRSGEKALVFFGPREQVTADVPDLFAELVRQPPVAGDEGDRQFTAAWLWMSR